MDFYVLKKNDELIAVPASEQKNCKQYLDSGYFYIDKIAACDERSAISALKSKHYRNMRIPLFMIAIALPLVAVCAWHLF